MPLMNIFALPTTAATPKTLPVALHSIFSSSRFVATPAHAAAAATYFLLISFSE